MGTKKVARKMVTGGRKVNKARTNCDKDKVCSTASEKLSGAAQDKVSEFLDMTEFCLIDLVDTGKTTYEVHFVVEYVDVDVNATASYSRWSSNPSVWLWPAVFVAALTQPL